MAIIYSYPLNDDIKPLDELVGTTEKMMNGQLKTVTRNFLLQDLAEFFIVDGGLQREIILTTNGSSGVSTLNQLTGVLNIPQYDLNKVTSVSAVGLITSTGGLSPAISTSLSTNKLVGRYSASTGIFEEITLGTGLSFFGNILNASSPVTPYALTRVNDTNVTLTLGGSPNTALLQNVSLTLGWNGTLEDSRIASASIWNAKQSVLNGTGFVKSTAGIITYDTNTYYLASNPNGFITYTSLSSIATGLTYNNITGVFSLSTGYSIPTITSQTNWDTAYNYRLASLTTTGTSGPATLVGNVLNIPDYSEGIPSTPGLQQVLDYDHSLINGKNFQGTLAGGGAAGADYSNFFGDVAGYAATGAISSNFFGQNSGYQAINALGSNFIGRRSGEYATSAGFSNFIGNKSGSYATNASYSNFFGYLAGASYSGNNVGSNNIIIGSNISLPNAATNSINLGGVLFGTGTNSYLGGDPIIDPSIGGKIGIGVVEPTNTLHIYSETEDTSGLRLERLTSTSPTSTGQAIGVDTSGNVVTVEGGGGSQDLQSVLDIGSYASNVNVFLTSEGGNTLILAGGAGGTGTLLVSGTEEDGVAIRAESYDGIAINAQGGLGLALYAASIDESLTTDKNVDVANFVNNTLKDVDLLYDCSSINVNTLDADGIRVYTNTGIGTTINQGASGKGLVINGGISSVGNPISFNKNGVDKLVVNQAGELTATKLIKSGGTSSQILAANGSVITAGTNITISGGTISAAGGGVTSVTSTSPITSSGGTTPVISTSMATNKLIGRSTSGTGVMEEITIGSGLTLSAGTLTNTATATPLGYYGAFQDMLTQTLATANVGQPFLIRTVDESNGVSITTNGSGQYTRITPANTGTYNIQWSGQFQNPTNAIHDVNVWFRKGLTSSSGPGTDIVGSNGLVALPARKSASAGEEGHTVSGWNFLLTIAAGEYVEFYWMSNSTQVTLQAYSAGSPPPSTASLIVTVTQQSGIMAGTGITALGTSGNAQTGATQTLATNGSGTDFNIVSSGNTHTFNLPTASATNRGALSSTNWTTFNDKLTPNTAITGATNTKITYDANGLVTAGTTLIASDIPNIAQSQVTSLTTDLGLKANLASPTFTGTVVLPSTTSIGNVSSTEIGYLDNVTSSIQTQLDNKIAKNVGATYTTNTITTVTAAEYAAIVTKDANTLYFII